MIARCTRSFIRVPELAALASAMIALAMSGCTPYPSWPSYNVAVSALAAEESSQYSTVFIIPGIEGVDENDLQYREYRKYMNRALEASGYTIEPDIESAELAVSLYYEISDPKSNQTTKMKPVFGSNFSIQGWVPTSSTYTTYLRYVHLTAVDMRKWTTSSEVYPVWETQIISEGSSADMRKVFPVLAASGIHYYGSNSEGTRSFVISEGQQSVIYVKGRNSY